MFCPDCGTENNDTAEFCIHCGQPLVAAVPASPGKRRGRLVLGLGTLLVLVVSIALVAYPRLMAPADKAVPTAEPTRVRNTPTPAPAATVVTGPGGVRLAFAPQAAVDVSGVTISEVTDGPPPGDDMALASPVFEIAGAQAILPAPAKLTLPVMPEALAQRDERSMLVVAWWDGSQWLPIGGEVDEWQQTISVETQHLSLFAAFRLLLCAPAQETDHFEIIPWRCPEGYSIDELGQKLEDAWELVIQDLQYETPRQVEKGQTIEVWIVEMEKPGEIKARYWERLIPGYLNYSIYVNRALQQSQVAYIAAHEFFHIVQVNSYLHPRVGLLERDLGPVHWWMEATATWMGAKVWGDQGYVIYREYFQEKPESFLASSLDSGDESQMYRAGAFVCYLEQVHEADVIRQSWAKLKANRAPVRAIDQALRDVGTSLAEAYWGFSLQHGYLRESDWLQRTMDLSAHVPEPKAVSLQVGTGRQRRTVQRPHLSGEVLELLPVGQGTLALRFDWGAHSDVWRVQLFVERHDDSVESREIVSSQREVAVPDFGAQVKRVIVVAANTSLDQDDASLGIELQLLVPTPTPVPTFTPTATPTATPALPPPEPPPGGYAVELVGHMGGDVAAVAVQGQYAYAGCGPPGLMVIDVSDPARPREVGRAALPPRLVDERLAGVTDVAIHDRYAYVTVWNEGLWVIDVSTPSDPKQVGFYEIHGLILNVFVSNSYVYIATGNGLSIVDVSDPARPHEVAYYAAEGIYRGEGTADVFVSGRYAYLSHYYYGLIVLDVSDPTKPHRVGGNQTPGGDAGVAVSGSLAYTVSAFPCDGRRGCDGLRVYDVSRSGNPKEVGSLDAGYRNPGNWDAPIVASGRYLYLAAWEDGLRVIDVSDPAQPREVSFYDVPRYASNMAASGGYVYLASGSEGLYILRFTGEAATEPRSVRTLAFLLDSDVWTIKEDGTDLTQLTTTGVVSALAWSPDGREIAYLAHDAGGDADLYLVNADGSSVRRLTHGARAIRGALGWHSSNIAFLQRSDQHHLFRTAYVSLADASGAIQYVSPELEIAAMGGSLIRDPRVRWSPDGQWIAVSYVTAMGVAAADGSGFHQVHLLHPEWKSDSSHILHTSWDPPGGIRIFDPRTNSQGQLSDVDADYAVYSPDGQPVAYADGSRLRLMNADGTGHRTLVDGRVADLAWSPNGDKIAYASWEPSALAHSDYHTGLHLVNANGSGHLELVAGSAHHPAWQPE